MQINILSIGDEFSAVPQRYLGKIAKSGGDEIVTGNLILPGASLKRHCEVITDDVPAYQFDYTSPGSVRFNTLEDCAPSKALGWTDWDYITVQQSASLAGMEETFFPYISEIASLLRKLCPRASLVLHETWAFDENCAEPLFEEYHRSTAEMADKIRQSYIAAAKQSEIHIVFPVGEAWNAARQTALRDGLTLDGLHSSRMGDFLSGAVWYEILTGNDVTKNSYRLPFIPAENVASLKKTAHEIAVEYSIH